MKIAGQRRGEAYPSPSGGGAALIALQNRNVAATPFLLTTPFTPEVLANATPIAAALFTPKVSGVIQITASISLVNGATPETYGLIASVFSGTGLTVSGGEGSSNGWFYGSNTPPTIGGSGIAPVQNLGEAILALATSAQGSMITTCTSQPLPLGVPVVLQVLMSEIGGGNPIAGPLALFSLSVVELP